MSPQRQTNKPKLAKQILKYFLRNPAAVDSFEGVVRWRLLDEAVYHAVDEVGEALEWLVREGYLQVSVTKGTGQIFSLNAQKRPDAERFLREPDKSHSR
jgi:hypothetical protein